MDIAVWHACSELGMSFVHPSFHQSSTSLSFPGSLGGWCLTQLLWPRGGFSFVKNLTGIWNKGVVWGINCQTATGPPFCLPHFVHCSSNRLLQQKQQALPGFSLLYHQHCLFFQRVCLFWFMLFLTSFLLTLHKGMCELRCCQLKFKGFIDSNQIFRNFLKKAFQYLFWVKPLEMILRLIQTLWH